MIIIEASVKSSSLGKKYIKISFQPLEYLKQFEVKTDRTAKYIIYSRGLHQIRSF